MAQKFLSVKNFEKYQHYKQRNPPWIKLHKSMLGDRDFQNLPITARFVYIGLLILASETDNRIVNDPSWIAQRLAISPSDIDLRPLYRSGFLQASEASIRRYHQTEERRDREETEAETETERASASDGFAEFWKAYPRKDGKEAARKSWGKLNGSHPGLAVLLAALDRQRQTDQWLKDAGKFVPHASTWLNGKRWEDEVATQETFEERMARWAQKETA